ncbi:Halomucin [Frankliniella fusca]|uniref:Halomucin n=1 Tax=Frankliniella fusca TaxID=407009 RepID=A0AAE1H286_9NEOP|nr:Halomucin [Frankliniella fusca]
MDSVTYWCVVRNLDKPNDPPKVVTASDLFEIRNKKCVRFRPKSVKVSKHEEFGMVEGNMLLKHSVVFMSAERDEAEAAISGGRTAAPVRLSISPTALPLDEFTFPEEKREKKLQSRKRKKNWKDVQSADSDSLLKSFLKKRKLAKARNTQKRDSVAEKSHCSVADDLCENESISQLTSTLKGSEEDVGPTDHYDGAKTKQSGKKKNSRKDVTVQPEISVTALESSQPSDAGITLNVANNPTGMPDWNNALGQDSDEDGNSGTVEDARSDDSDEDMKNGTPTSDVTDDANSDSQENGKNESPTQQIIDVMNADSHEERKNGTTTPEMDDAGNEDDSFDYVSTKKVNVETEKNSVINPVTCPCCPVLRQDLAIAKQQLEEAYAKIQRQDGEIKAMVKKEKEGESLLDKMKAIIASKDDDGGGKSTKRSRVSKLDELPSNLYDGEHVDPSEVKVDKNMIISKDDIVKVQDENVYFTARVEGLVLAFYGAKAYKYSVKESCKYSITSNQISAMEKILLHMKWSYSTTYDVKKIKTRIIKYTSRLRTEHRNQKKGTGKEKKGTGKEKKTDKDSKAPAKSKSDKEDSSSSDSSEGSSESD